MIRFFNGRLLTLAGGLEITGEELWTEGDQISYIGPTRSDAPRFEREIDLQGDLLMPGFKNAHAHSAMTFLRSYADDLPLHSWLFDKVFPLEARLTPEHIYALTKLAILEYLTSGVTAAFDMYFFRDAIAAASADCGFRTVICGVGGTADALCREYETFNAFGPLVSYLVGFHAEYTSDMAQLEAVAQAARQTGSPVYTHNSETKSEVDGCLSRHGVTPTVLFESLGLFENGGGGFHCVHMSDEDLDIFRRRGLWAVTNPGSNAKLASGIAPITRMLEAGVNLAIGTDGPASNNALDMFREMYLVTVLQKLAENDAAACPADRVLQMATVGSARAMGLSGSDTLAPGKQADLVVIDLNRPNMRPIHDVAKNLVYSGSKENVRLTMVAGKILFENGQFFVGEDYERIYQKADEAVRELTRG